MSVTRSLPMQSEVKVGGLKVEKEVGLRVFPSWGDFQYEFGGPSLWDADYILYWYHCENA